MIFFILYFVVNIVYFVLHIVCEIDVIANSLVLYLQFCSKCDFFTHFGSFFLRLHDVSTSHHSHLEALVT